MSDTQQDVPQITAEDAGTWLEGSQGWHNTWRVVDRARDYGFEPDDPEGLAVIQAKYEAGDIDPDVCEAMSEAAEDATEYLQSQAPEGHHFEWDMGELSLVKGADDLEEASPISEWPFDAEPGRLAGPGE